jgi:carboxy-cis,cis-muconate cyclase
VALTIPSESSASPRYLLASTRSRTTGISGYVSAFSLDADTGAVSEQLFLLPTTNSGGVSNAVAPAPWGDERYFGLPDSVSNFVEIWRIDDNDTDAVTAAPVVHLDLSEGPANMIWYS